MNGEINGIARTRKSVGVGRQPAYSRPLPAKEFIEERRPVSQHPSRMQFPAAAGMREIGLKLHEILALTDMMREAYGNGEMAILRKRLSRLMLKTTALESALSQILMPSTPQTATTDTTCKRFDIVALLQEACEAARSALGDKPVAIMDVSCPGPVVIHSDPSKIKQIVTCLLSNATKFTLRGRIALILGSDDDKIRLTVADTGRGMAPEQISAVLKPAGRENDGERNGQGLGIVKELLNRLNGSISIASKQGEGTIVEISLPLEPLQ